MTNKERWFEIRSKSEFPLSLFYNYYLETAKGYKYSFQEFCNEFLLWCQHKSIMNINNTIHITDNYTKAVVIVIGYYDNKFKE